MRPANVDEEQVKLRAFPFTLEAKANEWLYNLPPGSMNTWNQVKQAFLEQYFPATKAASIKKDICAIRQQHGEPFGDYYERFTHLVASCPNHQISEHLLIQYFYEGLCGTDRVMLDAASGRAFMDKTPINAKALLKNIAGNNTRQFGGRDELPLKKVNEVSANSSIELQLANLTELPLKKVNESYQIFGAVAGDMTPINAKALLKNIAGNTRKFGGRDELPFKKVNEKTDKAIENLERQMSQLASLMRQQHQPGRLPSQTVVNPNAEQMNVVTLRSGKEVFKQLRMQKRTRKDTIEQGELQTKNLEQDEASIETEKSPKDTELNKNDSDKQNDKEILDTFRKVQVNLPLLDAIKQMSKYAKFLKELCMNKRRFNDQETVALSEEVSAVLQRKLPPKLKDAGSFTIPCVIGGKEFGRALCDFGASINLMPYSVYESLNLGDLKETKVVIQLTDRSNRYPKGLLEDVLVQLNELIFPADFFVLEMEHDPMPTALPLILGRPFLRTARTKIDVYDGTLTMEIDGESVKFKIFNAMRYPSDLESCLSIDAFDYFVQDCFNEGVGQDNLEKALVHSITHGNFNYSKHIEEELIQTVASLESLSPICGKCSSYFISLPTSNKKTLPFVIQAPKLELKPIPEYLKYAFLGEDETLPVIISSQLTAEEGEKLIRVLKDHKTAIAWSIADIKGINPATCMHRILLEEGGKPTREAQRRLNPLMMEVVKKEVIKLLDVGIIYPISDSKWVSPIQVIPKRSGVTVVKNEASELVPTHVQNSWRIAVAPENQENTTFTCPFGTFAYRRMPFGLCNAPATFQRCMSVVAFNKLKELLSTAPPDWSLPFELMCDASDYDVGAVLGQRVNKVPHVIYYASRTLNDAQLNYSTTENELLAVVFALEKFRSYLIETKVIVFSDHAALKYLLTKKDAKPRLIRWILLLQEFDLEIKDKKGSENVVADHLSRFVHSNTEKDLIPLRESFPDEQLFSLKITDPWYADIINYKVIKKIPDDYTCAQKDKLVKTAKYYEWVG
nr:uncharacterized protein LOC103448840 [Malus domestica]